MKGGCWLEQVRKTTSVSNSTTAATGKEGKGQNTPGDLYPSQDPLHPVQDSSLSAASRPRRSGQRQSRSRVVGAAGHGETVESARGRTRGNDACPVGGRSTRDLVSDRRDEGGTGVARVTVKENID